MRTPVTILAVLAVAACGDKKESGDERPPAEPPPAAVSGLDAIPRGADAVVGIDVAALRDSELVADAVRGVLARDPGLERRIGRLLGACGLDPARDLESVLVATGDEPSEAVMVVTGALDAGRIPACVADAVAAAGGSLQQRASEPRPIWVTLTPDGATEVWFAFGAPRTLVAAASLSWLSAALGDGPKLGADRELMALVERADRGGALWAAGRVDPRLGDRLGELTRGAVEGPIRSIFAHLHLDDGLRAELGAVLAGADDAAAAAGFAREQLRPYTMVAQGVGLGGLVSKLVVEAEEDTVFLRLHLSAEELKEVMSQIDSAARGE